MRVVIFDLDHTLIHCDSFTAFCRYLILRRWWRVGLTLVLGPAIAGLWVARRTRILGGSALIWIGTVGMDHAEFHALMDGHVAERFGKETELVCRSAVRELQSHVTDGARVVVVTGSLVALAERVCKSIGAERVEVVGSTLRSWMGGWVADQHCFGPHKVVMLADRGTLPRWDCVYTDSAADIPILEGATRRVVVNPRPNDRVRIEARLGADFEIVEWT
jgi:phosphatidylglycerophosphatase C